MFRWRRSANRRGFISTLAAAIAGAIMIDEYRQGLVEASFGEVLIDDSGSDLNAYAKVENQQGCCSPAMTPEQGDASKALSAASSGCCAPAPAAEGEGRLHGDLSDLLSRYNVNDYTASVKVFAVKPL